METTPLPQNSDAYRMLRLREGAPRELVEEAYWLLINQQPGGVEGSELERFQLVRELNRAYEAIARDGHGKPLQRQRLTPVRRGLFLRREQLPIRTEDPYEMLFLSGDAGRDVALLARAILLSHVPPGLTRAQWDSMLADAVERVANHDVSVTSVEADAVNVSDMRGRPDTSNEAGESAPAQLAEERIDLPAPPLPIITRHNSSEDRSSIDAEGNGHASGERAMQDEEGTTAPEVAPLPRERTVSTSKASTSAPDQSKPTAGASVAFVDRVFGRNAKRADMIEEQNDRLLKLRPNTHLEDEPVRVPVSAEPASRDQQLAAGQAEPSSALVLGLNDAGSNQLLLAEQIVDEVYERTLGSGSGAARIQIWRRGLRYMLRNLDGSSVAVNGVPLTSPIVVLEDGDEIARGNHSITFRLNRTGAL